MSGLMDRFKGAFQNAQEALGAEVSKLRNRDALDALVGASVMIAAADGSIDASEKQKLQGFLQNSQLTKAYSVDQIIKVFAEHAGRFEWDADVGKAEALRIIGRQRANPDVARSIARLAVMIGKADGDFDQDERRAATLIVRELGLDPAEFEI